MTIASVAESFQLGPSYTSGSFRIRLKESVRRRYRKHGTAQDAYELIIDTKGEPKVKRAAKEGDLISWFERLRYGPFARFALVTNQPAITSLLSSLIPLGDDDLTNTSVWHLLTYDVEWKVESAERLYLHFLRNRAQVSEFDIMAAIAGDIRDETMHYLRQEGSQSSAGSALESITQTMLEEHVIPHVNQRIEHTGVTIRRFYRSRLFAVPGAETNQLATQSIADILINLRHDLHLRRTPLARDVPLRAALVNGLLSHLCQELKADKRWLAQIWRLCGFDIGFDEMQAALGTVALPLTQTRAPLVTQFGLRLGCISRQPSLDAVLTSALAPASVVQRLKDTGRQQLRIANRTIPQEIQRRGQLRRKALAFFELALLLSDSPILIANQCAFNQNVRFELFALIESLREIELKRKAQMAFQAGSTVHLMAVAAESAAVTSPIDSGDSEPIQLVQEILPLVAAVNFDDREPVVVWTPTAAARQVDFVGSAEEIELMLQVLEPHSATATASEAGDSVLFWTWKVRANHEQFSVRLRSTNLPTLYDVELKDAEFITTQPSRSAKFPELPHIRLKYEPLEMALLIDGYWLAGGITGQQNRRNGLSLLIDLLDGLDKIENLTKRGLLIHAVICLDDHISEEFRIAYGSLPSLYTLGDAPIETTAQLVAEWLQPWVARWNAWEIKPFPVDTDISLEKGFHYLRHLKWQQTAHPEQRAILAIGRSRPHDHAKYFSDNSKGEPLYTKSILDRLDIPYHPEDRFSVANMDWREDLRSLRESTGTILALCDPGLPNPRYHLSPSHVLFREYQEFWATVDPGTRLDISDEYLTQSAEMGIDRVLQTLDTQLFQRRAIRCCEPSLTLPLSQNLIMHEGI